MFAKRLLQKARHHKQQFVQLGNMEIADLDIRVVVHYGIPSTASVLAFDPIQRLLAIGTLDGRIKVIGGDNIEGLLISPKQLPYKYLEFIQNRGFLVSVSTDNDIQVWDLEKRCLACCLTLDSNITAFSVICGSYFIFIGDEYGLFSVLKYECENGKLVQLPYHIPANSFAEVAGISILEHQPIVGVLPQACSSGSRVLIAYQNGLIILWDILEAQIVLIRGDKDLQVKHEVDSPSNCHLPNEPSECHIEEKEISALCWASSSGALLAVGYVDGDILLWKTSSDTRFSKGQEDGPSNSDVIKLQISSAERRLPVIVLQWSKNNGSRNDCDGQLFIYGGDEIGSDEVLTILSLEWSSGMETLRCVNRVDLTLPGSFADMILLPKTGPTDALFVLTNPGQLHFYDDTTLSMVISQQERKPSVFPVEIPMVIPTADPNLTVSKLSLLNPGEKSSKALLQLASAGKLGSAPFLGGNTKWPLTGGVPSQLSAEDRGVERVYIGGYQDGSVRIWDATLPVLSLICILEGEVQGTKVTGSYAPVSALDFCFQTLSLAVGNECGQVQVYKLNDSSDSTNFHFVTETEHEVHVLPQGKGTHCGVVFSLFNTPVQVLQFANRGTKVIAAFGCGRVAMLDLSLASVLFLMDPPSVSSCPVISVTLTSFTNTQNLLSKSILESELSENPTKELMLILTRDTGINIVDGVTGKKMNAQPLHLNKASTAISMYVLEGHVLEPGLSNEKHPRDLSNKSMQDDTSISINSHETETHSMLACSVELLSNTLVLLCSVDSLRLYRMKSLIQGDNKSVHKVNLPKMCCWTTTFKQDEKVCGLVLLYQTGVIEIRSLPDLELVKESSLMSILRWNFKPNMEKTISSTDNGQIVVVNGCEMGLISILASENGFRLPESLPSFHDEVLAAAADAAMSFSSTEGKKQGNASGVFSGIIKGLKGGKAVRRTENVTATPKSNITDLDGIFSRPPFSDLSVPVDNQEQLELSIDDIEIDEPLSVASTSFHMDKNNKREKGTERERLFEGATTNDIHPKVRTREEIVATYRKTGDASSAAAHAKDKLLQRQEKLERISRRTEELQSGAEDFASLANELVKTMEGRKWWKI